MCTTLLITTSRANSSRLAESNQYGWYSMQQHKQVTIYHNLPVSLSTRHIFLPTRTTNLFDSSTGITAPTTSGIFSDLQSKSRQGCVSLLSTHYGNSNEPFDLFNFVSTLRKFTVCALLSTQSSWLVSCS